MTNTTLGDSLPLSADADALPETALVERVRALAREQTVAAIALGLNKVTDELQDLIDRAFNRDVREAWITARAGWPAQRATIESEFGVQVSRRFDPSPVIPETSAQFAEVTSTWSELSLVADEVLEEEMRLTEMATRLRNAADEELAALDARMSVLLGRPHMERADNPLAPGAIAGVLRDALSSAGLEPGLRLLVLRILDESLRPAVLNLYREINALLKERGILPTVRYGDAKKPLSGTGPVTGPKPESGQVIGSVTIPIVSGATAIAGTSPGGPSPAVRSSLSGREPPERAGAPSPVASVGLATAFGAGASAPADSSTDLFTTLQQLLARLGPAPGQPTNAISPPSSTDKWSAPPGFASPPQPLAAPSLETETLLAALASATQQLALGHASPAGTTTREDASRERGPSDATQTPHATLIDSLTRLQQINAAMPSSDAGDGDSQRDTRSLRTSANVLRDLRATGVGSRMEGVDLVTLDIMALLFDQIFGDSHTPIAMRALIGRLQIPMLKVAVLDKSFFSRKTHPSRQLLDTLGELSLGLDADFLPGTPVYDRIESILAQLIEEFEKDFSVFERATLKLAAIMDALNRRADQAAKREWKRIRDRERLEVARLFAQNEIRERIKGRTLPRAVLRFLSTEWMKLLIVAYAMGGRETRAWHSLVETLDILMWSLLPKQSVHDRKRMVMLLPGLLKRISKGMDVIGTDAVMRERFNAILMRCHARTIAGQESNALFQAVSTTLAPPPAAATGQPGAVAAAEGLAHEEPGAPPHPEPTARTLDRDGDDASADVTQTLPREGPLDAAWPETLSEVSAGAETPPRGARLTAVHAPRETANLADTLRFQEEMAAEHPPDAFPAVKVRNPFGAGDIEIEEVSLADLPGFQPEADVPGHTPTPDPSGQLVAKLKEGDWFEFQMDDGERLQARLSFISPYRSTFVFSNRRGQNLSECSATQVASHLRSNRLTPLEEPPLFDRAMGNVVRMLRKGSEAA